MGVRQVSQAEFSRLCACSREAVSKAAARREIETTAAGRVPLNKQNMAFREKVIYHKIGEQSTRGRVLPGWACLVGDAEGERTVTLVWYPPAGLSDYDVFHTAAAEAFDFDIRHERATRDGVVYRLRLEFDPAVPPPWLRDALAAGARRRARGRAVRKAHGVTTGKVRA